MKRTALKRKTPVKRQSANGAAYEMAYAKASAKVRARSGGRCEIESTHDCDGTATLFPHHRKLRSQGGSNDLCNLIDVCWTGHDWLHRRLSRSEAVRLDLIVPREVPEHPYAPPEC